MAGNQRKDFSIKLPKQSLIGVNSITNNSNISNIIINNNLTVDLTPTGVTAGTYGSTTFIPVVTVDVYGRITYITQVPAAGGGGGGILTANNGLTLNTATNVQWGGTLLQNTVIDSGTYFTLFTGNRASPNPIVAIQNTGTGSGLSISTNYTTLRLTSNYSSLNTVEDNLQLIRTAPGLVASGIGQAIQFRNQSSSGSIITANKIISEIVDVTPATFTSKMRFLTSLNALDVDTLTLYGDGKLQGNKYGLGVIAGTPAYNLVVDASGNFIEAALGGSATWGAITGTLTSQTDLINYLTTNYYPLTGNPSGFLTTAVLSVNSGINISVDNTNPAAPIINSLADRYKTSSTTSNSVSNGIKTFTVDINLSYIPLQEILVVHNPANHMHGEVVSYSGTTLVVDIKNHTGSGTYTSWVINLDGTPVDAITGAGTINELAYFTGGQSISSLSVAIYPNLTELSYVKGVTSAIQTQINGKQNTLTTTKSVKIVTNNVELDGDNASPGNNQVYGTDGSGVKGWKADPTGGVSTGAIVFQFDGAGGVIPIGQYGGYYKIPYNFQVTDWVLTSTIRGTTTALAASIVIDTYVDAAFPNTVSIWGGSKPTLSGVSSNSATGLSINLTAGHFLGMYVDSSTTGQLITLTITGIKS